ncbi:hypothetical protein [Novibacillus thermophilus]|uniref:Uncharacterized protein n=1 Tax=Novibacillus thermophilus TaxID=1471761 RepID=A0A1U9K5J9_9BACL|nr:hypothetical protein [Novibacillus thermophilus]AQS55306.1 hypothetical protein B0W44_05420 [Novibacillus thermophilus]
MGTLTDRDRKLAREYLIFRSAQKALRYDRDRIRENGLKFRLIYEQLIENVLKSVDAKLDRLSNELIRVSRTDQATVYDVRVKNRRGYIEVSAVDVVKEVEKMFIR